MNRELRHTVHYLAARARKGDAWAFALLQRLSVLARTQGLARGAASSLEFAEEPSVAAAGDNRVLLTGSVPPLTKGEGMTDDKAKIERYEFVEGLRALADFYDHNPDFPLPSNVHVDRASPPYVLSFMSSEYRDAAAYAQHVSCLGGARDKEERDYSVNGGGSYLDTVRELSPTVRVGVTTYRETVCEKRVVGTEKILVPDPSAPLVEVEHEIVEWDCKPVLA